MKGNIQIQNIEFEKFKEDSMGKEKEFHYSMEVTLTSFTGDTKSVVKTGQITLINEAGIWKISLDKYDRLTDRDF